MSFINFEMKHKYAYLLKFYEYSLKWDYIAHKDKVQG